MKVGDTVYLEPVGNAARRSTEIREAKITKIGRKYFYVGESWEKIKVDKQSLLEITEFSRSYDIWLSRKSLDSDIEKRRISYELREAFKGYGTLPYSLEALRKIAAIIQEETARQERGKE